MTRLCQTKETVSSVALAAEIWEDRGRPARLDHGIVEFVLQGLNQRGLIIYSLADAPGEVPIHIKVTTKGFKLMGYRRHTEVGRRGYHAHIGEDPVSLDRTDFRTHSIYAEGVGPIERLPWRDHCAKYGHWQHARFFEGE